MSVASILQGVVLVLITIIAICVAFATWTLASNLFFFILKLNHLPQPRYPFRNPLKILTKGHGLLGYIFHTDPVESGRFLEIAHRHLQSTVFVVTGPLFNAEVIVYSASAVKTIAQSASTCFMKPLSFRKFIKPFAGDNSIFVLEGSQHRRLRHAIAIALQHENVVKLGRHFMQCGKTLANELANEREKLAPVYIIRRATFGMIITACFGENVVDTRDMQRLLYLYNETLNDERGYYFLPMLMSVIMPFIPSHWLSRHERNKLTLRREVRRLCADLLQRRQGRQRHTDDKSVSNVTSLLSIMHEACDEGQFVAEELEKTVLSFLVAGQATTTIAFAWTVYLLAVHEDWQKRVYEEIRMNWDARKGLTKLDELPVLGRVVKEVIRLHPPLQNTVRRTACEVCIDGYKIPAGVTLRIPIVALQNLKKYWGEDANTFNPDRFLALENDENTKWLWSAFWFGSHSCVGQRFAMLEIKVFLAMTLLKYRVTVAGKHENNKDKPTRLLGGDSDMVFQLREAEKSDKAP